ncbi:bifunctional protein-disulfide isomerase/oxidoreductase DsbC [Suttonella ornithocola]|uniref:Thiol:disulfide interchange protein n=1 Tax=Suttonella ornithocola TaxID=279832 RepID=A0A380MPK6_9GAMM|nr:bifunctional protein-disulfide isomerase/oxidoreductase DsbC [Suttonella ornithocola]SUO93986.1 Thiol:disulfide interchange protein DsbC precursor [Suttonella ornithocola]
MQKMLLATAVTILTHSAIADDNAIKNALSPFNVTNMEISDSPIAGLKQVVSDQGIFYATEDGKYFLQGTLVEITDKGPVDLTNRPLMKKLESMVPQMIVYPAKDQKHVVNVFTDITCPYCMRLHKDMQGYNDRGITIRYLAFPRAGGNSKVAGQMEAIWKSDDPKAAFDAAEKGKIPSAMSPDVVQKQYNLGLQFNVTGTPALILEDGTMLPGYHKPDELIKILDK